MIRSSILVALVVLAGCSGGGASLYPHAQTASRGFSDSATAMPGDAATAMPGDAATAMPGATFSCAPALQPGAASCTLAVNVNVSPNADPQLSPSLIPGLHPADLTALYALPSANAGGTVAIVDAYDAPVAETDLAVYRAAFGLPACTSANGCFRKIDQRGGALYPVPNAGWAQEVALDLDMVSAACPHCSILLVEADSATIDDLGAAVDTAAAQHPLAISNSYYALEWAAETNEDVHYRHPGIALTASSGDRGKPSYPAVSSFVTSVGGTTLTSSGQTAWAYGGRGCSAYVARPTWGIGSCATRAAVDLAAIADPQTGVAMFAASSGGWLVAGGTSVGAPLVAAAYALGTPAGPGYSYTHRTGFHAIATGGFDSATGLGTPSGVSGL